MIIRAPKPTTRWYQLDHDIARDKRLGFAARGVLIYILTRPDNWKLNVSNLRNECADSARPLGRDALTTILRELESVGYLYRHRVRDDKGRHAGMNMIVAESPAVIKQYIDSLNEDPEDSPQTDNPFVDDMDDLDEPYTTDCGSDEDHPETPPPPLDSPAPGSPQTANPFTGNPALSNNDIKDISNTEEISNAKTRARKNLPVGTPGRTPTYTDWENRGRTSEALDRFVEQYPVPASNRQNLRQQWFTEERPGGSCESQAETIMAALHNQLANCSRYANQRFVVKPETYLHDEKWLDKIVSDSEPPASTSTAASKFDDEYDRIYGSGGTGGDPSVIEGEVNREE